LQTLVKSLNQKDKIDVLLTISTTLDPTEGIDSKSENKNQIYLNNDEAEDLKSINLNHTFIIEKIIEILSVYSEQKCEFDLIIKSTDAKISIA
jgi:hypothetical protein